MGLFLHESTSISKPHQPRTSALAVWSLLIAASGFLNVIGFVVGPLVAVIALLRLRVARASGAPARGRPLAIGAIWLSALTLAAALLALLAMLLVAYAQLPEPRVTSHFPF